MADARVEIAIKHWAPRFVEQGVPVGDFTDITASIERWDEWCSAFSAAADVHVAEGDKAEAAGNLLSAGYHFATAAIEYHFGKYIFTHDIPQMRAAHDKAVAAHRRALPYLDPPAERIEIPYDGSVIAGNLRLPHGDGPWPLILMISGLDSTKEEMTRGEQWMLDRGIATFSFDGPGQGEAEYDLPMEPRYEKPVGAVLDALAGRDQLDLDRVGAYGQSLGGYYVARATAMEPRIKAMISISGPFTLMDAAESIPLPSKLTFQVRTHTADWADTLEVLAQMDLEGVASKITQPSYIVTGENDGVVAATGSQQLADAVNGPYVLDIIPGGNHVAMNRVYRWRPQTADWMAEQLGAAGA